MNTRAGSGWQTVLADLSLILFMVTAAAVSRASAPAAAGEALALGEPVAAWRPGTITLAQWLAEQPHDPRLQLTIVAHVAQIPKNSAVSRILEAAGPLPQNSRIVLERGPGPPLAATLAYDNSDADPSGDAR